MTVYMIARHHMPGEVYTYGTFSTMEKAIREVGRLQKMKVDINKHDIEEIEVDVPLHYPSLMETERDLLDWVWRHTAPYTTPEDIIAISQVIQNDPNHPNWGEDWEEYFINLPESLGVLIGIVGKS